MADMDKTQRVKWMTTLEVLEVAGFDPRPFLTSREPTIRAKLQPAVYHGLGVVTERLWLADEVLSHPQARKE